MHQGKTFKSWYYCWVVLEKTGKRLMYFKDRKDNIPKSECVKYCILVGFHSHVSVIHSHSGLIDSRHIINVVPSSDPKAPQFAFNVVTPFREYVFAAKSKEEMQEWMKDIAAIRE